MKYVYSTLPFDQNYSIYKTSPDSLPVKIKDISIKGGAQLPDAKAFNLYTPTGIVTRLEDDDTKLLESHPVFIEHKAKGFVRIEKVRQEPEKVVAEFMTLPNEEEGAPLTSQHVKEKVKREGMGVKIINDE